MWACPSFLDHKRVHFEVVKKQQILTVTETILAFKLDFVNEGPQTTDSTSFLCPSSFVAKYCSRKNQLISACVIFDSSHLVASILARFFTFNLW